MKYLITLFLISALTVQANPFFQIASSGGETVAETPFSPSDISGLTVWLKSDSGTSSTTDEGAISTWSDQSGNGNHFTQATGGNQPTYETTGINGKPVVNFDGSNDYMERNLSSFGTIFVVSRMSSVTSFKAMVGGRGTTGTPFDALLLGPNGTGSNPSFRWGIGAGSALELTGLNGDIVVNSPFIAVGEKTGTTSTSMRFWWNGSLRDSDTSASAPIAMDKMVVGAGHYNDNVVDFWPGDIAEVILYDSSLTELQRINVEDYLAERWGVTLANWITLTDADGDAGVSDSTAGNVDGDSDIEFVSASPSGSADPHLAIWNLSGTTWTRHNVISGAAVSAKGDRFGTDVRLSDIDSDGDLDIVLIDSSNSGNTGSLLWYEHPGTWDGTWSEHTIDTFSGAGTGNQITHAEVICGDINGDGRIDIASRDVSHGAWVWIQAAPGDGSTWNTRNFTATNPREGLGLADIDDDGDLDIVLNGIWLQTPADPIAGTYTVRAIVGAENWYPAGASGTEINDYAVKVAIHDFDGDGREDIVLANAEELSGSSATKPTGIKIYFQPSDEIAGTWTTATVVANHRSWHNLELADYDGDGDMDIFSGISDVGVDTEPGKTVVFVNGGNGASWSEVSIAVDRSYQLSVGDADSDGDTDVFSPEHFAGGELQFYVRRGN
jgi:hypothetical protein